MRLAIVGAGSVGATLGAGLARAGHKITYGVRDVASEKHVALRAHAALASVRDAVAVSDAVVLATPWNAAEAALEAAGDFAGKALLDATNPIGPGFQLTHGWSDSGAEQVARWAKNAQVVKVFNSTGAQNMGNPLYGDTRSVMFVCGDAQPACATAAKLATDLGFDAIEVGPLSKARTLEPLAMLWIQLAMVLGNGRDTAFGILRRST
jgi:8-hydroxy-5-deazaflavin:NADPH oxidoreductase